MVINVYVMFYMIIVLIPVLHIAVRAFHSKISHFCFWVPVTLNQGQGHLQVKCHIDLDYYNYLLNFMGIEQK